MPNIGYTQAAFNRAYGNINSGDSRLTSTTALSTTRAAGVPTARLRRQRRKNFDCHAEPGELAVLLRLLCTPSSENVNETSKLLTRARDKKRLAAETVTWNREEETPRRGLPGGLGAQRLPSQLWTFTEVLRCGRLLCGGSLM
ncbi:unnamed protein product [Boreogadus saida]